MVMTPASPWSVSTGRWRMRFAVISAAHWSTGVSGAHAGAGGGHRAGAAGAGGVEPLGDHAPQDVALGEDPRQAAAVGDDQSSDGALVHELRGAQHGFLRRDGDDVPALFGEDVLYGRHAWILSRAGCGRHPFIDTPPEVAPWRRLASTSGRSTRERAGWSAYSRSSAVCRRSTDSSRRSDFSPGSCARR